MRDVRTVGIVVKMRVNVVIYSLIKIAILIVIVVRSFYEFR